MLLSAAIKGMIKEREALQEGASNPSIISDHTYKLAHYVASAEECLSELEENLEKLESESFNDHLHNGKTANAAKELIRREFADERAEITKTTRLITSGWKLVTASQSRVNHLIAEANNQI